MRAGLFVAILASLLVVLSLTVPLRIGPRAPTDALPPLSGSSRCLQLEYPRGGGDYLPTLVRLEPDYAPFVAPRRSWYLARSNRPTSDVGWRPWGVDSIDISSYHWPRIRLPAEGDSVEGQVVPTGVAPLAIGIFWQPRPVRARRVSCQAL